MAGRRSTKRNDETNNVQEEIVNEPTEVTETDNVEAEIVEGDNVVSDNVEAETPAEEITDISGDDTSSDDNSEDKPEEKSETEEKKIPPFVLPADPKEIDLGDPMLTLTAQKILSARQDILNIDRKLETQNQGNSETAIFLYAESDEAGDNVKSLLEAYREHEKILQNILADLTKSVRTEKGDVTLTDEQLAEMRDKRANYAKLMKTATEFFKGLVEDNDAGSDAKRFIEAATIPGARKSSGTKSAGTTKYASTTNIRPRIGHEYGGYIAVGEKNFEKWSDVVRELKGLGFKNITTGALHNAWAKAGNFELANWVNAPSRQEVKFEITDSESNKSYPVTVFYVSETDGKKGTEENAA